MSQVRVQANFVDFRLWPRAAPAPSLSCLVFGHTGSRIEGWGREGSNPRRLRSTLECGYSGQWVVELGEPSTLIPILQSLYPHHPTVNIDP